MDIIDFGVDVSLVLAIAYFLYLVKILIIVTNVLKATVLEKINSKNQFALNSCP